jgi:hypothetical protein
MASAPIPGPGWIKLPLDGISWTLLRKVIKGEALIEADITGRRPHARDPTEWRVVN